MHIDTPCSEIWWRKLKEKAMCSAVLVNTTLYSSTSGSEIMRVSRLEYICRASLLPRILSILYLVVPNSTPSFPFVAPCYATLDLLIATLKAESVQSCSGPSISSDTFLIKHAVVLSC
jgi:hypothetical protein